MRLKIGQQIACIGDRAAVPPQIGRRTHAVDDQRKAWRGAGRVKNMLRRVQPFVRQPSPLDLVEEWLEPLRMLVQDADGSRHITSGSPSISATRTETGIFHPLGQLSQQSRARRSLEAAVRLAVAMRVGLAICVREEKANFVNELLMSIKK